MRETPPFRPTPFRPAWWLPGGHLQTLAGKYFRSPPPLPFRRVRMDTPDGDFLDLDFGPEPSEEAPLVVVLHGLEGFSRRPYVLQSLVALQNRGLASVALNFRSCSGEPNRLARLYHSGDTEDLATAADFLARHFRGRPLGALGFSMGGNVLLKLLGERGEAARELLGAAAAISVPYDLAAGVRLLDRLPMGPVYTRYFLGLLKEKVRAKEGLLAPLLDLEAVYRTRSLGEFDDQVTAPLHGFRDAEEYYRLSSSAPFLPRIRIPTFLAHALDDPFLPPEALPVEAARANPAVITAFHPNGGHVGFLAESRPGRLRFWAEEEEARFLQFHLEGTPSPGVPPI